MNALELAALLAEAAERSRISIEDVGEALQRRIVRYDRAGDTHYDVISAFIKSVRGSDPDAALYWLFLMLEGGEDPEFIVRRLIILASEDIGLADSRALQVAVSASQALAYVGLPEATYHLTHATLYLAASPKSNSIADAIRMGKALVRDGPAPTVPMHLRSTGYSGAGDLGHGEGYLYPHDYPGGTVGQQYFPDGVDPTVIFRPGRDGDEAEIKKRLEAIDQILGRAGR